MYRECPLLDSTNRAGFLAPTRDLLASMVAVLNPGPEVRRAAAAMRARYPRHAAQADAGARLLGVHAEAILLGSLSYDLTLALFGCSTMALATPDGPVLARNMDWPMPEKIARASCVVPLEDGRHAGFPGTVGVVSGLSRHGFAVVLNAVPGSPPDLAGYPVLLFLRHLLDEARGFDEAVRWASDTRLVSPALLTLVGTTNDQRVCVERTPSAARQRWADGNHPLVTTNHYLQMALPSSCPRYDHLCRHAPRLPARPPVEDLLDLLAHPEVRQDITAQHVVACPATDTLRLFVPAELLDEDHPERDDLASLRELF
jgi:hypothetical protein